MIKGLSAGREGEIEDKERKLPNQDFIDSLHDPEISEAVLPAFAGKYGEIKPLAPRRGWPNAKPHGSRSLDFLKALPAQFKLYANLSCGDSFSTFSG